MRFSRTVTVIGAHAEGEVGRVITGGVPAPPGDSLLAQREHLMRHGDDLRRFLLYEPRGGAFCHANLLVPPKHPRADAAFIIMEPTDYPAMSGSNAICVATVLLETGMVAMREPETRLVLETPGGLVEAVAHCADGACRSVAIRNVPSFATHLDELLQVDGLGELRIDIAYGGAFFVLVEAAALGLRLEPAAARRLVEAGEAIKAAAAARFPVRHPDHAEINTITFTEFVEPVETGPDGTSSGRNAVVISPGKIDRSPCGTGTSARLAVLHAKGAIAPGARFVSRSLIGSQFDCRIVETATVGGEPAIVPEIAGRAWLTGIHQYGLDPTDPFPTGYTLSDTWYRAL